MTSDQPQLHSCPQCGERVLPDTQFCPNCGYYFEWSKQEVDSDADAGEADMTRDPLDTVIIETEPPEVPLETLVDSAEKPVTCTTCGEGNEMDRTFCTHCGNRLDAAPPPDVPPTLEKKRQIPVWVWVSGGVVALIVVLAIIATGSGDDEPSDVIGTVPSTSTTAVSSTTQVITTVAAGGTSTTPVATSPPTTVALPPPQDVVLDTNDVTATRREQPPTIDGDLSDWTVVTTVYSSVHAWFRAENWTGPDDLHAEWKLGWDDDFFYFAVETFDDVHSQERETQLWRGDSVDVEIDASAADDGDGIVTSDDFEFIFSPGDFKEIGPRFDALVGRGGEVFTDPTIDVPGGMVAAAAKSPAGFTMEGRIPWSVLGVDPGVGVTIGLALSTSDNDTPGSPGQETMVANHPDTRVARPGTWGRLTLES